MDMKVSMQVAANGIETDNFFLYFLEPVFESFIQHN